MSCYEEKRDQYIHDHALEVTLGLHYVFEAAENRIAELEAENERLKTALVAIQSTTPGSAHRIAIQALAE